MTAAPTQLQRTSAGAELAALLQDEIFAGRLEPGEPMREASLASAYDVSRRSVREALAALERDGLVRHHRHRGARVTLLEADDIRDLYEVRRVLEPAAARAVRAAPDERRDALTEALEQLRTATRSRVSARIVVCDLEFHRAVVGLLASPRIDAFFASIATEMRFALTVLEASYQESRRRPRAAFEEHRAIHDALRSGDRRVASRLITEHIDVNEQLLLAAI